MLNKSELQELNLFRSVRKNGNTYSINDSRFQPIAVIQRCLFQQRNVTCDVATLTAVLNEIAVSDKVLEKSIQEKLHKLYGGKREVTTPVGRIDLLTDTEIIEVKESNGWKAALGQIISYGSFYPDHRKRLYLFGDYPKNIYECFQLCKQNKVSVTFDYTAL